jgi:hypothetical protein
MDGHSFLSWNIPNTLTVWLMAAVGAVIVYGVMQWHKKNQGN